MGRHLLALEDECEARTTEVRRNGFLALQTQEDEMSQTPYQANGHQTFQANYSNASERVTSPSSHDMLASKTGVDGLVVAIPRSEIENCSKVDGKDPLSGTHGMVNEEQSSKLAKELNQFAAVAKQLRQTLVPAPAFVDRCRQAFEVANDLFANAPTWICFYRELMGGNGMLHLLFDNNKDFGAFLRTDQYHQVQLMLTALRSRDLPENDPNDPQRMITVRLPKSLHEAMCEEAGRLNISVNRLCISRMLQLLDPEMIPETNSKPRGRKPRTRTKPIAASTFDIEPNAVAYDQA